MTQKTEMMSFKGRKDVQKDHDSAGDEGPKPLARGGNMKKVGWGPPQNKKVCEQKKKKVIRGDRDERGGGQPAWTGNEKVSAQTAKEVGGLKAQVSEGRGPEERRPTDRPGRTT